MYTQDYDETLLPYSSSGVSGGYAFPWTLALQPYTKNWQVYHCPDSTYNIGYTYNANLFPQRRFTTVRRPKLNSNPVAGSLPGLHRWKRHRWSRRLEQPAGSSWPYPYNQATASSSTALRPRAGRIINDVTNFNSAGRHNPSAAQVPAQQPRCTAPPATPMARTTALRTSREVPESANIAT